MIEFIIAVLLFVLIALGGLLIAVPLGLLRAFVLADLWKLFFVPLGLPAIGVIHFYGILISIGLVLVGLRNQDKEEGSDPKENLKKAATQYFGHVGTLAAWWGLGHLVALFL